MGIKKMIFVACLFVLAVAMVVVVGRISIKTNIEKNVSKIFGLPAEVDTVESGYLLKLKGLKIKNPDGFKDDTMLDISDMTIDKNLGLLEVHVKELLVEKSPAGRVNIDYLKPDTTAFGDLKVKKFDMHLEKVIFKDDRTGKESIYNVNINKEYSNLPNAGQAPAIIVSEGLDNTNLPDKEGINPPAQTPPPGQIIETTPPPGQIIETTPPPGQETTPPPGQETTPPPKPSWQGGWN